MCIRDRYMGTSEHVQEVLRDHCTEFVKVSLSKKVPDDMKIEALGILSHISLGEDWLNYLNNNTFLTFLENLSEYSEEDFVLQMLCLVNKICENPKCTEFLYQTKIIKTLPTLLIDKHEDDEFVYLILKIVKKFLLAGVAITYIINQSKIMEVCLQLVEDSNQNIRAVNNDILDIVLEYDDTLAEKIKEKKFCAWNKVWLESVQGEDEGGYQYEQQPYEGYNEEMLNSRMWDSDSDLD
eukprot:TRINITY_DN12824_c0_g3_i3.p1 TRINITY_DN12824_c0_g3~~TRINITY_DN12824_c0_g3_i3.p1  ORF type:complete len:238 (+),score=67.86 TRINITY_DN12824_c0_g3_i3:62-775(+)